MLHFSDDFHLQYFSLFYICRDTHTFVSLCETVSYNVILILKIKSLKTSEVT